MQNRNVDHLRILGLPANATKPEIKQAYKDKLLLWHPDKVPNTLENYQEIVRAFTIIFRRIQTAYSALNGEVIQITANEEVEFNQTFARMNELRKYNFSTQAHAEIMQLRRENERLLKQVAELERREKYKQPVLPNNQTGYEDPLNRPSQAFPTRFNTWNNPAEPAKRKIKPEGLTQVYIIKDYYNLFLNLNQPLAAVIYLDFSSYKSAEEFRQRWNNYPQQKNMEFYFEFHLFENGRQSLRSVFKVQNELCLWMSNNGRAHKMLEILKEHFDMDDTKCHVFEELPSFLKPFVPTYRK